MRKLYLLAAVVSFAQGALAAAVWIDSDVAIGSPIRDVDDAYALVLALHSPELRIVGMSTTYGNAPLGHTTRAARTLVREFGGGARLTEASICSGARSRADLGRRTAATDALAAALKERKFTYIALGPLTNLATFLRRHPELAQRIERVIFVGGQSPGTSLAIGPNESFRIHDANVFKDPTAAAIVMRSHLPLVLFPVATVSKLRLNATDLRELEKNGGAASYLARRSRIWLWFWTNVIKSDGGAMFDAPAIIALAKPELLLLENRSARIDHQGNLLVTKRRTNAARPVQYCSGFAPQTKRFVMQRLMRRNAADNSQGR
jgi:inosine-uridine nucleoside N-ribohydrolase